MAGKRGAARSRKKPRKQAGDGSAKRRDPDLALLNKCPTLAAYARRIDAVSVNFLKLVVYADGEPTYGRVRRVVVTIYIGKDGELRVVPAFGEKVSEKDYQPTKDEAAAIAAEVKAAKWPKCRHATPGKVDDLRAILLKQHGREPWLFVFEHETSSTEEAWGRDGDKVIEFVQQRVYDDAGNKNDLPWTFWDDGKWRMMEPDGPLPLWGKQRLRDGRPVMVHEGAKSAEAAHLMCTSDDPRWRARADALPPPVLEELKRCTHLGWPGGAENPHRVDWTPIAQLPRDSEVTFVADNDPVGMNAVANISRMTRRPMRMVSFDEKFPKSFDLAEPWPDRGEWWSEDRKRYCGPTLRDLTFPATWATDVIPSVGRGRSSNRIRAYFAAEWRSITDPPVFVHHGFTDKPLTRDMFNKHVRPFSDADDTARLLERELSSRVDGLAYMPGTKEQVVTKEGRRLLQTWRPTMIEPIEGNVRPFVKFLRDTFPVKAERRELLRWCATLVERPDIKMSYSVLLISEEQGVGKGTLAEKILAPLVGLHNTSFPSEHDVAASNFNGWAAHKVLAVVHEIYAGESQRAYDRMKSIITDRYVTVNEKFVRAYQIENHLHCVACSNSESALYIDQQDRRWFAPRVTNRKQPPEYWMRLNRWLTQEGGLGIIRTLLQRFLTMCRPVAEGQLPPMTEFKQQIIDASRSKWRTTVRDLAEAAREREERVVIIVDEVRDWLDTERGGNGKTKEIKVSTIRKELTRSGLFEPQREEGKDGRIKVSGRWRYVVSNKPLPDVVTWSELKSDHHQPSRLMPDTM